MHNTKYGKGKGKLLPKIEEISRGKAHTNTWKLIQNILTVTDIFLNLKRVIVCEHMTRMPSLEFFKGATRGLCERKGWRENIKGNYLRLIPGLCLEE